MAKKEEIVDLKPEKVTEEQLTQIQTTVNNINRVQLEIGITEVRKSHLIKNIDILHGQLDKLQKELTEQYGTNDIDINTGVIKYPENGEANKEN
tara:strand:+ start:208 stop:489 length:282 start_codon:yes stop_codon:yes gene_type:complete